MNTKSPLLTICVCTYNRSAHVTALVSYLLPVVDELEGSVELLVSNNVSTDDTSERLSKFTSPNLTKVERTEHLRTGEEHIYGTLGACSGRYIWCLGDDDQPNLSIVRDLPGILSLGSDFFLFNSLYADPAGGITGSRFARINTDKITTDFRNALALGYISTLPGISNAIFSLEVAKKTEWRDIRDLSPFYSHVAWWFRGFRHKSLTIVNRPLVRYHVEDGHTLRGHFNKVTRRYNFGELYPWGLGLIKQLDLLEREGALSAQDIRNIWEFDREAVVFRLLDNIVHIMNEGLKLRIKSEYEADRFGLEEMEFCMDWILRMDPGYMKCVRLLWMQFEALGLPTEDAEDRIAWANNDFWAYLGHKQHRSNPFINHIESYRGFDIYEHRFCSVAFRQGDPMDRQGFLRWCDPVPIPGRAIVASNSDDLKLEICQAEYLARSSGPGPLMPIEAS